MISVCMATYNGEKYIKEQLESILCQLASDDEVIISDDGSKDSTLDIIESLHDNRIKVFENEGRHGVVPNFENAIKRASGDYIFLSDQDDVWAQNKVVIVLSYLKRYDFISHNAEMIDSEGHSLNIDYFSIRKTQYGFWNNLYRMGYLGCCMAFKRKCLDVVLPFPKDILWHDMWITANLHLYFHGIIIQDCLLRYRRHGNNASPSGEKSTYSIGFKIKYRLFIIYNLLKNIIKNAGKNINRK